MKEQAVDYLVFRSKAEIELSKIELETEENGRKIANYQGVIAGNKEFLRIVFEQFANIQQDSEERFFPVNEMDDDYFNDLILDCENLRKDDDWKIIDGLINDDTETAKSFLLFEAEKGRDLDVTQGQHRGQTIASRIFREIEGEKRRRENISEEEARNPRLPFDAPSKPGKKILKFTEDYSIDVPEIKIEDLP